MGTTTALDFERTARVFHALSDPTRLAVLNMLREGECCVCELQDELGAAQSRLSFHLRVLKDVGLVTDRREGRWSYYTLAPAAISEVQELAGVLEPKRSALPQLRRGRCCD